MPNEEAVREIMDAVQGLCDARVKVALSLYPPPDVQAALQATIADRQHRIRQLAERLAAAKSAA